MAEFLSNGNEANYSTFNRMHNHGTWSQAAVGMIGSVYAQATTNTDPLGYSVDIITTDQTSGVVSTNTLYIDETAYNEQYINPVFNFINSPNSNIQYIKKIISIFDYENSVNESKRTIKLLQTQYVKQFVNELTSSMKLSYN